MQSPGLDDAGAMSTGAYSAAYQRSLEDPDGFWGEAAQAIDWVIPPPRVLDDDRPPFYRWFTGGTLNTCFNALDRHVAAGRGDQPALHYDSPGHRHPADHDVCRAARRGGALRRGAGVPGRREGRPGRHLHADGAGGGRGDARLRPHRGGALGGLRWVRAGRARRPHRGRQAGRRRVGARAGSSPPGSSSTSRCSTPPSTAAATSPRRSSSSSARRPGRPSASATPTGRSWTGPSSWPTPSRPTASRSTRPTRSTSSTRPGRPDAPRASCATTAATPSRCAGRWRTSTASGPATPGSPRATSAGSSATPTSSTRRC